MQTVHVPFSPSKCVTVATQTSPTTTSWSQQWPKEEQWVLPDEGSNDMPDPTPDEDDSEYQE
eukprot:2718353-Heterocapsa_arctica.AAC.1